MKKVLLFLLTAVVLTACSNSEGAATETEDLKLVLDWTPNTNHTGLYVAEAEGYFEEQGLNVEIMLPGEAGADQLVASGQADFGVSAQETLTEARIQDIPVVSIGAIIQHNTSGFASPVEKEITSPADYEGKAYGGWGAPVEKAVLDSLMKTEGADVEQVEIVNMGNSDFFTAVERDIDFAWIYYGWTGVEAELRGQELNMQYLTDYSEKLDYYTPVLTTNETMIEEHPETVEAFMAAVTKGYQFSIDNPEAAAEHLIKAVPDLDPELVRASQEWLSPKYKADAEHWGEQKLEVWQNYAEWMVENNLLEEELDAESAFTNEFLPQ
ncbi:ABC transporter substrate-binding protein [Halobacillus litoralis]|uniref:ABC transporter substrate-binding protein n=1 Tax=Halobacillus litoralis TaxID=45668 RepID=UPI001CD5F2F3|nr:ABC transporter substrate-binding protein [Halobacillus litoralis]MCA0972008.1 ABC transporter substrate-binding protein [Halobacillus litoralis]